MYYNDTTFCKAECGNTGCFRNKQSIPKTDDGEGYATNGIQIAFADFSSNCTGYSAIKKVSRND